MPNLNVIHLMGNLTRDIVVTYTPGGTAIASFGMAINERWKDSQSGEMREKVIYVDLTAWGKRGEVLAEYCAKGHPLYIQGRLNFEQWDDKTTGAKRSKLSVTVDEFQFLKPRDPNSQGSNQGGGQQQGGYGNQGNQGGQNRGNQGQGNQGGGRGTYGESNSEQLRQHQDQQRQGQNSQGGNRGGDQGYYDNAQQGQQQRGGGGGEYIPPANDDVPF